MKNFLNTAEVEILKKEHKKAKNKGQTKIAYRINAIILLNDGFSYQQVANVLLLDDQTIRRYEQVYQKEGLDGLKHSHYKGGLGYLTQAQEQELATYLDENLYTKAKDVVAHVKKTYKVTYTVKGMAHLLERLGFVYKKPKKVPGKADPEKQEQFLNETYEDIKAIKGEDDRIYFLDGVHPKHNPVAPYGWIRKGKLKEMPTNTGRDRININAAIDITDFDFIYREDDRINAISTIALFEQMEQANPKAEFIFSISDNARYYKNKEVQAYLDRGDCKIILVHLPAYAPNLNLIERLWRFLREEVLCHYYEKFKDFKNACLKFFDNLSDYKDQLTTLLTENFQIIGRTISQT